MDEAEKHRICYFNEIYERRHDGRPVERRSVRFADGSAPLTNKCHDNVDRWVREDPNDIAVRGWVVMANALEQIFLGAHSIVQSGGGGQFDITPLPDIPLPFIPHRGAEGLFEMFKGPDSNLWWPPLDLAAFE